MNQKSVPKKSNFGNKFSNYWFWVETGINLEDTQSGFRLYPLLAIKDISFMKVSIEFVKFNLKIPIKVHVYNKWYIFI